MTAEESIQQALVGKFPALAGQIRIQRARRIWAEAPADLFEAVFKFVVEELKFPMLCTITGQDEGARFTLIYHLAQENGVVLNLKSGMPREQPAWKSVVNYFAGCVLYEREIADLLGVQFAGLPPGSRYPLPENWPAGEHPLRKDWQPKHKVSAAGGEVTS